jgi:transcriptional regulator NrdR family protein
MNCHNCGEERFRVMSVKHVDSQTIREKICANCGTRYLTVEIIKFRIRYDKSKMKSFEEEIKEKSL